MQDLSPSQSIQSINSTRGFARVASKIASDPDKTTTIYRRFDELSARNLLFYQAEIAELEELQKEYDRVDWNAKDEVSISCQSEWCEFVKYANGEDEDGDIDRRKREKEKLALSMKIREKLERYHAALANHQTLLNSPPPSESTILAMRNWFFHNTSGSPTVPEYPHLWGASSTIYTQPSDLVALRVPSDQDRLSQFIQSNFGLFFQAPQTSELQDQKSLDGKTIYISEHAISRFVAVFSTLLAAVLLFGAIISLYVVKNEKALLGMLSAWTVLFAACVGLLTNARRDQIFGATAAYAAVLVVFVSGNLGSAPSSTPGTCVCTPG